MNHGADFHLLIEELVRRQLFFILRNQLFKRQQAIEELTTTEVEVQDVVQQSSASERSLATLPAFTQEPPGLEPVIILNTHADPESLVGGPESQVRHYLPSQFPDRLIHVAEGHSPVVLLSRFQQAGHPIGVVPPHQVSHLVLPDHPVFHIATPAGNSTKI
jgi:hypothetical protein